MLATEQALPFGAAGFLWYLALTEVVALGTPMGLSSSRYTTSFVIHSKIGRNSSM